MTWWPGWVERAALWWTIPYAGLGLYWALGGAAGYPWKRPDGELFFGTTAIVVQGIVVVLAAGVAVALRRFVIAAVVAGVQTFGLVIGLVGAVASGELTDPLGLLVQVSLVVGTALYAATATVRARIGRGRCPRCGGPHPPRPGVPLLRPEPAAAPRRTRILAYVALLGIVPWAGLKSWLVNGGDALGMTAAEWEAASAETSSRLARALESAGVDITVLAAAAGAVIVVALGGPWAQRLRLPRWLVLGPAWASAVSLVLYGYPLIVGGLLAVLGVVGLPEETDGFSRVGLAWVIVFGGLAFAGLGTALAVAARSWQRRTRPHCAVG